MSRPKAFARSIVRYVYWKVGAYADDPKMKILRETLLAEARTLIDTTTSKVIAEFVASREPVADKSSLN